MKYISAYTLLVLGGNNAPTVEDVTRLLKEAGVEAVAADVKAVVDVLKGKNLSDVIKEGLKSVSSLSVGGGSSNQAVATQAPAAQQAQAPAQKAPEPPKKAEEPEEDIDMGGLFD